MVRACAKLLAQVLEFEHPADALLSKFFRENRKLGLKDRNVIAETTYTILRHYLKLTKVVAAKNSFTLIGYTWVKLLGVGRHEIRELRTINLGELDKLPELDMNVVELPEWVIKRLSANLTMDEITELAKAMTKQAPLTLRVNTIKTSRNDVLAAFAEQGIKIKPTVFSPYGVKLNDRAALIKNELFLQGLIEVQDEASQLAGLLLEPKRGDMVVDFCAGSGGKTLLFGMLMKNSGRIYAFDVNERRLGNLTPRLARSGLSNVYPQLIASENDSKLKRLAEKMDRVFVDAPCLGLGTLRRNPDLKFRQNEQGLAEINVKQLDILTAASRLVKPGGVLVYATCSILRAENQDVVENFLSEHAEFEIIEVKQVLKNLDLVLKDQRYLELNPVTHDTDGFFACIMQKSINEPTLL
ncbi:MAG: RsmB/NOP family class I SAM-dependent RNA methyltransferase [Burkholderiales bacterium]|nr:RsmB/NOP family class I SAM-dependent RNA methyltransferase [Burkholderiales bacterium]